MSPKKHKIQISFFENLNRTSKADLSNLKKTRRGQPVNISKYTLFLICI